MAISPPVTNPETPSPLPTPRPYVPRIVEPVEPPAEREDKFAPRYVEVPALRERGFGRRNLAWGVIILVLALGLLVAAVILAGQKALLSVGACLVTFTALYVLARMHIFRQRNGGFLAVAVVVLLGAAVPLLDRGYEMLAGISQPAGANAAPAPAPRPVEVEPPLLTQSFALARPEATQTQVRVLKDSRVVIAEKPFLIKVGDAFPLLEAKGGEVTFAVRDLHVSLPVGVVEILGGKAGKETRESAVAAALGAVAAAEAPKLETIAAPPQKTAHENGRPEPAATPDLAAITRHAQQEAMRRYPALAVRDSLENEAFVTTYRQLKESGNTEFFANPEWPLELAVLLATRNGWARGDRPANTEPPRVLDAPEEGAAPGSDDLRVPQVLPSGAEPPQAPFR